MSEHPFDTIAVQTVSQHLVPIYKSIHQALELAEKAMSDIICEAIIREFRIFQIRINNCAKFVLIKKMLGCI
jgi:hypothetical protein